MHGSVSWCNDRYLLSLTLFTTPACFKKSIIVLVSKHNKATCLKDWRPVVLTSIINKCFEKHIRNLNCTMLPTTLDPLQHAYHYNRTPLQYTLPSHGKDEDVCENAVCRLQLSIQQNSGLDTNFRDSGLNPSLCSWIFNFLTGPHQVVYIQTLPQH